MVEAGNTQEAQKMLPLAYKAIDKAAKRGVIKDNTAARKKLLAQGAQRLLAAGGLLVIRETFSAHLHPAKELVEKLGRLSFANIEVITPQDDDFEALTEYYGPTADETLRMIRQTPRRNRYFCIARQPA